MATSASPLILGVRHHGPGSARSVLRALEAFAPDLVLIEGPVEAAPLLALAASPAMQPPVALLVYVPDAPELAAVYPFAEFSPEWQALQFGLARDIPVRFTDLPQRQWLSVRHRADPGRVEPQPETSPTKLIDGAPHEDPLDLLAEAAGLEDGERWWEAVVEETGSAGAGSATGIADTFGAVLEAMAALRQARPDPDASLGLLREAAMRLDIREAQREGYERIAVVCGAWHAPMLAALPSAAPSAKADRDLLRAYFKDVPKVKVSVTWVPWSYTHLTFASGYGAGVTSPSWYEHLWRVPEQTAAHWLGRVARLLRDEDLSASAGQVIDAVRLAEALAALRGRARPGLLELNQATQTVLCFGESAPLSLIAKRLVVGNRLGQAPAEAPMVPLQADLEATQRRLRFKPQTEGKRYDLDLRNATDLARSVLLHRLLLLSIPWGRLERTGGARGTFHELWTVAWDPAFTVTLVAAARWGNTVEEASLALLMAEAREASSLPALTKLLDRAVLADLPAAVDPLTRRLQSQAALSGDVAELIEAVPALARALRYGTVRQTSGAAGIDVAAFETLLGGMVARICLGLPLACSSLDEDAAQEMLSRLGDFQEGLALVQRADWDAAWVETVHQLVDQAGLHGLLAGYGCRLLLDAGQLDHPEEVRRLKLVLSPGTEPAEGAAWLEGFLQGSGLLLLHDQALWATLDAWVTALSAPQFVAVLPLLRRTFATFSAPERRQMGERVRGGRRARPSMHLDVDVDRANPVLPTLAWMLGFESEV